MKPKEHTKMKTKQIELKTMKTLVISLISTNECKLRVPMCSVRQDGTIWHDNRMPICITAALEAANLSARLVVTSHLLDDPAYNRAEVINALKSKGRAESDGSAVRAHRAETACMAVLIRNAPRSLELIAARRAARAEANARPLAAGSLRALRGED